MIQSTDTEDHSVGNFIFSLITLAMLAGGALLFYFCGQSILADHLANEGPSSAGGNFYGYAISVTLSFMCSIGAGINALFSLVTAIVLVVQKVKRRDSSRVNAAKHLN